MTGLIPELPDWLPSNWADFVEMRRAKGKRAPLTDAAQAGILRKLAAFKALGYDVEEVLQTSIENGWSGVFPPKGGLKTSTAETFQAETENRKPSRANPVPDADQTRRELEQVRINTLPVEQARERIRRIRERMGIVK
jgi:hypothetical protein